jgi:hypothetical protein
LKKTDLITLSEKYFKLRLIADLKHLLQQTSDFFKQQRQELLRAYVRICALRIQKTFRGFLVRKYEAKFRKALGCYPLPNQFSKIGKLEALALGWKTRRIMKLKEVRRRCSAIKDHEELAARDDLDLNLSRAQAVCSLIRLVAALHQRGSWLTLKLNESVASPAKKIIAKRKGVDTGLKKFVSITAGNRFETDFRSEEYKRAARLNFQRRMKYNALAQSSKKSSLSAVNPKYLQPSPNKLSPRSAHTLHLKKTAASREKNGKERRQPNLTQREAALGNSASTGFSMSPSQFGSGSNPYSSIFSKQRRIQTASPESQFN